MADTIWMSLAGLGDCFFGKPVCPGLLRKFFTLCITGLTLVHGAGRPSITALSQQLLVLGFELADAA